MGTKLYIKTYGCQMNEYDSQKTLEILKKDPAVEETDNPNDADIILLNTCSIREKAEEKVYSELGRLNKLKKICLLYTSPSPRDKRQSRMPSSA